MSPSVSSSINVQEFLASSRLLIEAQLDRLIPKETEPPQSIHSAIRWSVFASGKRFRPALLFAVAQTFGVKDRTLDTACALEMIHTYSLIHDDLPSMDDDNLRRGRPTCHVKFGEAIAILAGDALQTLAFQTIAEDETLTAALRAQLISEIARAAGTPQGMVAGQVHDLDAESRNVSAEELKRIHEKKTGALITAAARCGAIIAGANESELRAITGYGSNLGLLFQITDDLLDITSTAESLGKTPGKDVQSNKATYPALYGREATEHRVNEVYAAACDSLATLNRPGELLGSIADFVRRRQA